MAYRVIRPATHQDWLDERKKGIGSSEAGTIMGVNHFDTPYKLWRRKTGVDGPIASSEAMELGHHIEPAVASMFAARTGAFIKEDSAGDWIAVDTKKDYLRVSPDRIYYADGDKRVKSRQRILECKTTSIAVNPEDFPVYWYCQLQYQMGVMGVKHGAVAWISSYPRLNFGYKEFDFNPEFYKALVDQLEIFWLINIQGGIAPDDINSEDTLIRNPTTSAGVTVQADANLIATYNSLKQISSEIKALEKTQTSLEDDLKMAMGNAETLVSPTGEVMALWRNTKPTMKFNAKAFQEADPAGYAKYMEPTASTRRFTVK